MSENHHKYTHAFLSLPNVGSGTLRTLKKHFGSLEAAWHANDAEWQILPKLRSETKERLLQEKKNTDPDTLWDEFLQGDIGLLTPEDEIFPALLRELPDAPQSLYYQGTFDWKKDAPLIAIVGSRKFTAYGEQVAAKLSEELTRAGMVVVSGLAFGIDSVAHVAALDAHGETIAVLGSGISAIAPTSHIPLARKIMKQGAVISEYPPTMGGGLWTFPQRNRIIAGMTWGTIVVEAAESSGSLITAQCALEYNREVFAVPGSIFSPYSVGTNALLKKGAKLVTGIQDILEELPEKYRILQPTKEAAVSTPLELSSEAQNIFETLSHEPLHIDKIIKATTLQTSAVSSALALLEIQGLAKNVGGMHYIRTS
jgi:DNA processing protein